MNMPSRDTLSSFLYSAILTSALIPAAGPAQLAAMGSPAVQAAVQNAMAGLRAHGAAGVDAMPTPDPVSTPVAMIAPQATQDPILSKADLTKILDFVTQVNSVNNLKPVGCVPLSLCAPNAEWPANAGGRKMADERRIVARVGRDGQQDLVITVASGNTIRAYRIHRDGTCVKAIQLDLTNLSAPAVVIDPVDAQNQIKVALADLVTSIDHRNEPVQTAANP